MTTIGVAFPGSQEFRLPDRAMAATRARRSNPSRVASDLPRAGHVPILLPMFVVSEEAAAAIRCAYEQDGELSAVIELRRHFPGVVDNVQARDCARAIAGWAPLPVPQVKARRLQREVFSELSAWQKVLLSRHPLRQRR